MPRQLPKIKERDAELRVLALFYSFAYQGFAEIARRANLPYWKCSAEYEENSGVWRDTNVPPLLVREIEKVLP